MSYSQKDNTLSLFPNDRKTTDKHPELTGTALIDGVAYFADAWRNESAGGKRYLSVKFKRKEKQGGERRDDPPAPMADDSIPW